MPKGSLHNKFNDFGAAPSENVWSGIEKSLDNKKKKRVVVIWWTTGLAAAFLVLFGIKSFYKTSSTIETNQQSNTSDVDSKRVSPSTIPFTSSWMVALMSFEAVCPVGEVSVTS